MSKNHKRNAIVYYNDKEIYRFDVPGWPRGITVGTNHNIYVSTWSNKIQVFSLKGKRIKEITYPDLRTTDGIAMDTSGNLLVADRSKQLLVYSPCGKLIKRIRKLVWKAGHHGMRCTAPTRGAACVHAYCLYVVFA